MDISNNFNNFFLRNNQQVNSVGFQPKKFGQNVVAGQNNPFVRAPQEDTFDKGQTGVTPVLNKWAATQPELLSTQEATNKNNDLLNKLAAFDNNENYEDMFETNASVGHFHNVAPETLAKCERELVPVTGRREFK